MNLSIQEIQRDLDDTNRDIACLEAIWDNLRIFIEQPGIERREIFRTDLLKYESLLMKGKRLKENIEIKLKEETERLSSEG